MDCQHYAIHLVSALIGILSIHAACFSKTIRWPVPRLSRTQSQQTTRHSDNDFKQTFPSLFYICQGVFLMTQGKWLTDCFWRSAHIMTQQTFKQPTGADCTPPSSLSSDLKWDDKASQFSMKTLNISLEPSTFLKMLQHHCSLVLRSSNS